jgi:cytidylate kinase
LNIDHWTFPMSVITISRQYGSGGSDVARLVAERLGWSLIDNDFVERVAERAGVSVEEVQRQEERVPGLVERLARALAISAPEMFAATTEPAPPLPPEDRIVKMTEAVIAEVANHDHAVLVGRGAQAYLAERTNTLHVYIVAPRDVRVDTAMHRLGADRKTAEHATEHTDDGRRRYVRTYYGRDWDDPAAYDLVINAGKFTHEQASDLIIEAARRRGLTAR